MQNSSQVPEPSPQTMEIPSANVNPESPYQGPVPRELRDVIKQDPTNHVGNFYVKEVLQFLDAFRNLECPEGEKVPFLLLAHLINEFRYAKSKSKPFRLATLSHILSTISTENYGLLRPVKISRYSRAKFYVVSPIRFRTNVIQFPDGTTWSLPPFDSLPVPVKLHIHRMNKRSSNTMIYPF